MTYHIDFESLAQRMIKDNSSFAHHLGELYIVSDNKNKKKILENFREYFMRFMTEDEQVKYSFNGA
jgi:uncharacterized protein YyaL (SSP411 family)